MHEGDVRHAEGPGPSSFQISDHLNVSEGQRRRAGGRPYKHADKQPALKPRLQVSH